MSKISSEQQKVDQKKYGDGHDLAFGGEKKIDRSAPLETGEVTWAEMDRRQPDVGQFTGGCMADGDNVADCKSEDAGSTPAAPSNKTDEEWTPEEANCWPLQLWHTDDQGNDTLLDEDVPHEIDWDRVMTKYPTVSLKKPEPRYFVKKGSSIDLEAIMKNVPGSVEPIEGFAPWESGWRYELKSVMVGLIIGLSIAGITGVVAVWMFGN